MRAETPFYLPIFGRPNIRDYSRRVYTDYRLCIHNKDIFAEDFLHKS